MHRGDSAVSRVMIKSVDLILPFHRISRHVAVELLKPDHYSEATLHFHDLGIVHGGLFCVTQDLPCRIMSYSRVLPQACIRKKFILSQRKPFGSSREG